MSQSSKEEQSVCRGSWERFLPCAAPCSLQGEGEDTLGTVPGLATKAVLANHGLSINHSRIGLYLPWRGEKLSCDSTLHHSFGKQDLSLSGKAVC